LKLKDEFAGYRAFLIDMDGVVWRGSEVIYEAIETVNVLLDIGKYVAFITNNSTRSRADYVKRLNLIGVNVRPEQVITSGYATALFVSHNLSLKEVYVIGEEGLIKELEDAGIHVVGDAEVLLSHVEAVVVGLDRQLTYAKLATALKALHRGAIFIATNEDSTLPTERGLMPGAGAIVAALACASGKRPDYVIGKPNRWIFDVALERLGVKRHEVLVIGDRLDTDVMGAYNAGMDSALVLTGVAKPPDIRSARLKPRYVLSTLGELLDR